MARILLIDDMAGVRTSLRVVLETAGHNVSEASDGADGIAQAKSGRFDLVITDMMMPNADGAEVIMALRSALPQASILAISGGDTDISSEKALTLARELGTPVLPKPFSRNDLIQHVDRLTASAGKH